MQRTQAEDYGKDSGEESAQSGSLVHLGISVYHATGGDSRKGVKAIEEGAVNYPLADVKKALAWFYKYPAKFVSQAKGKVKYVEQKVVFALPGTKIETVSVEGTVDLILESDKEFIVIDHKSGFSPSAYMLKQYGPQIAAYMFGAWHLLKKPKKPIVGYVSRLQDLHFAAGDFYYPIGFDLKGAERLLKQAASLYELYHPVSTPGKHCDYCALNYPHCFMTDAGLGGEVKVKGGTATRKSLTNITDLFKG